MASRAALSNAPMKRVVKAAKCFGADIRSVCEISESAELMPEPRN